MLNSRPSVRFRRYTLFVLALNLLVILWGGYVSASGSGEGCGDSWPLCAEAAERTATGFETFVEVFHRATSGLALIAVAIMLVWTLRTTPRGHHLRFAAIGSAIFILGEAAIGAFIVIARLVAENMNLARAFSQPVHLVNTYILLGFLGLTVYYAYGDARVRLANDRRLTRQLLIGLFGLLILGALGTIASLASTIFPSETFLAGIRQDFSAESHYLIRLRILHPILATVMGVYLIWLVKNIEYRMKNAEKDPVHHSSFAVLHLPTVILGLYGIQYALGSLNVVLLSPIWLQLTHLIMSDLIWLGLLWLGATALSESALRQAQGSRSSSPSSLRAFAPSRLRDNSSPTD